MNFIEYAPKKILGQSGHHMVVRMQRLLVYYDDEWVQLIT
jgi:hypothetical protein